MKDVILGGENDLIFKERMESVENMNTINTVHIINQNNKCPNCGVELTHFCYTTNPPQYETKCFNCGYTKPNTTSTIDLEEIKDNTINDVIGQDKLWTKEKIEEIINERDILYFAKVESNATIPNKRDEDAGYDIYTCETETIVINPNSTRMVDTGIAIACSKSYFPKFFDKGGMGSKGIIVGAGVGDSGYRDKYFIPLINTNGNKYVVITNQPQEEIDKSNYFDLNDKMFKKSVCIDNYLEEKLKRPFDVIFKEDCIIKPLNKAITQFVMLPVPKMNIKEISYEELKNMKSERGLGKLGSSGK